MKIPLHHQLLAWRGELAERKLIPWSKRFGMRVGGWVLRSPQLYAAGGWFARHSLRWLPRWLTHNRLNVWARQRELPQAPQKSFRELYRD